MERTSTVEDKPRTATRPRAPAEQIGRSAAARTRRTSRGAELRSAVLRNGLVRKLTRYTAGSVVATVISEIVFVVWYALGAAAAIASVAAFIAGAIPNYFLNRRWAWQHSSGRHTSRQAGTYAAIVIGTALLAIAVTSLTDAWSRHAIASHVMQVFLGGAAYFLTYAVMFLVKFALFDRVVFADRERPAPSR